MSASPQTPEAVLRRLEWSVVRRLQGLLQGDYRSLFRGHGTDLADIREYQYYDDVRHIDWNVTARLDTPYVRQHQEDREITAWFLLDLSPSIEFEAATVSKRVVLAEFTAVLSRLLTGKGNRVGALLFSAGVERLVPAASGRRQVLHLLDVIFKHRVSRSAPSTDLGKALDDAARMIRRRSVVFVVSDFITTGEWEKSLGRLALKHEVVAVRLFDPLETQLPDLGLVTFQDSETGEQVFVDTHDKGFRSRFVRIAAEREGKLRQAFASAGVDALELSTDDDLVDAIMNFAQMRKRRIAAFSGNMPTEMAS